MTWYVKGTDIEIVGTLERITGVAVIAHARGDSLTDPTYAGDTRVWWDEQRTIKDDQGRPIYVDEDGCERTVDDIEWRDDE